MKAKYYILCCIYLILVVPVVAQPKDFTISGYVLDEHNKPLQGVNVSEADLPVQAITGEDGSFSIITVAKRPQLVFQMVGFESVLVDTTITENLIIKLRRQIHDIEEIQVYSTGYQKVPKERSTGVFLQINNDELNRLVEPSVLQRLDGQVGGIFFDKRTNEVGNTNDITIRGRSTIYGNSSPLIVLDNFPYDGDINNIDPNTIESITVLRDAAAASIWGVRASNGVIVITSKKGERDDKLKVDFNTNIAVDGDLNFDDLPLMTSEAQIELEEHLFAHGAYEARENSNFHEPLSPMVELLIARRDGKITEEEFAGSREQLLNNDVTTALGRHWYTQSHRQQYAVNFRGGSKRADYIISSSYDTQTSSLDRENSRFTFRSHNTVYLTDFLNFNVGMHYIQNQSKAGRQTWSGIQRGQMPLYPYNRLLDDDGNPAVWLTNYRQGFVDGAMKDGLLDWQYRPMDDYKHLDNRSGRQEILLSGGINLSLFKGLDFQGNYQYIHVGSADNNIQGTGSYGVRNYINQFTMRNDDGTLQHNVPLGGILDGRAGATYSHSGRGMLRFDRTFGRHEITGIAGMDIKQLKSSSRTFREYGYDPEVLTVKPVDYVTQFLLYHTPSSRARILNMAAFNEGIDRMVSYYFNANYTFDESLSASVSARKDGSNIFGVEANNRLIPLWSAGIAYNLSQEPFFVNETIPYLKIRATYGVNGNIDNSMAAQTTMSYARSADRVHGLPFATIVNPPNPLLRWEKSYIANIGIDFSTRNKRIDGSLDIFNKRSIDLIGDADIDPTTGITISTVKFGYRGNVASMKGHGMDLRLESKNLVGPLKWNSTLYHSVAKDEVTDYYVANTNASSYVGSGLTVSPRQGYPVYAIFSYPWGGLNPENGNPQGYLNGEISESYPDLTTRAEIDDIKFNGSAVPTHFGNLRNTFLCKNWEVSFNISYRFGHFFRTPTVNYTSLLAIGTGHRDYMKRWQKSGDELETYVPSFVYPNIAGRDNFYANADVLVQKAASVRLTDIILSYVAQQSDLGHLGKLGVRQAKLSFFVSNLAVLWKSYKGSFDPDIQSDLRLPTTYTVAAKLSF